LHLWNKAAIAKTFWDLTHKQDKMWIRWIHSFYIKSKGKPSKKKREAIKRRQQKEAEIQHSKVQERQIPRNKNQQQQDDNSNHIRTEFN